MPFDRAGLSLYAPEQDALKLVAHDGCGPDSFYRKVTATSSIKFEARLGSPCFVLRRMFR